MCEVNVWAELAVKPSFNFEPSASTKRGRPYSGGRKARKDQPASKLSCSRCHKAPRHVSKSGNVSTRRRECNNKHSPQQSRRKL